MTADLNAMLDKVNKLARERDLDPLVFALHGLRGLLPHLPRGLENIFHELDVLEGWTGRHEPNKSSSGNHETISALISLLTTFAEARGEYDLANTLAVRDLGEWVSAFRWSAEEGTELDFDALATRAATEHEALLEFTPTQGADERELRTIGVSRARWAELLTNVALAREDLKVDLLLERYAQLRARYEQARLDWATDAGTATAALRKAHASFLAEQMWCAWRLDALEPRLRARRLGRGDQMSDLKVQIGWRHAYDALRGRRPIWPDALLSHLLFDRADFVERLPAARARDYGLDWQRGRENAPLLPHSVRALVLLGDGLASGPWQTLSRSPRFESVGERVRLAAGLVRAAWLHALRALAWGRGWLAKGAPLQVPEQDLPFLKALRASGVSELERGTLLSWGEARLFTSFERFADLPAKEALEQQMLDGFTADAREAARGDLIWRQLLDGLDSYTRSPAFADLNLR